MLGSGLRDCQLDPVGRRAPHPAYRFDTPLVATTIRRQRIAKAVALGMASQRHRGCLRRPPHEHNQIRRAEEQPALAARSQPNNNEHLLHAIRLLASARR
eukprot:6996314-Prymnesium_polylepis.1